MTVSRIGIGATLLFVGIAYADPVPTESARQLFMQGSRGLPLEPRALRFCTERALQRGGVDPTAAAEASRDHDCARRFGELAARARLRTRIQDLESGA